MSSVEVIAAVVGATVTTVTVCSLSYANKIHARMVADENRTQPTHASIAEKRRLLERDRKEWLDSLGDIGSRGVTKAIEEIDKKLMILADEESRIQEV